MAEFVIRAADERGHVLEQHESAQSESELRDRYTQQGMLVYSVRPRGLLGLGAGPRTRLKMDQFVIFNEQFVTLVHAGLPITVSLDLLIKQQKNAGFRALLENVRDRVRAGSLLSDAFAAHAVVPRLYTTTLLAGEKSGNLEEVLRRYTSFQRLALAFRRKLLSALIYPALLLVLVVAMLTFLITYVVPQFANLYTQLGQELPAQTVIMLDIGTAAQHYFPFIVAAVVLIALLLWRWRYTEQGAEQIDRARLAVPLLGPIWLKYQVAIFARMMSTLLTGGLPLVPALETAGTSMQSRVLSSAISGAARRVREGRTLAGSLQETGVFPELAFEMTEVGESTGALPAMLTSVAQFFEEDVETALTRAMSLIEPVILIVMGSVVAFVLLSLYMPIFKIGAGGIAGNVPGR